MTSFSHQADAALAAGQTQQAVQLAQRGAAAGEARALALIGYFRLAGELLPRDLPVAREFLRRAAAAGNADAALTEAALTANGSGGDANWAEALRLLSEAAARHGSPASNELALIDAMDLTSDGLPRDLADGNLLSSHPFVKHWKGFLTPAESAHIAMQSRDILEPSRVADPRTGNLIAHPIRTSSAAPLGPTRETLPIRAILMRIAAATGTGIDQGESLTVLHYAPGQQYRPHVDALPGVANQRMGTLILYLNEGYGGGETRFDATGLTVAGRGGDALYFRNLDDNGKADPLSRHAGLPVTHGAKWVATRWIRIQRFDAWNPA